MILPKILECSVCICVCLKLYMTTYRQQGSPIGFTTDLWSLHCRVSASERSHEDIRASWPLHINVTVLCVFIWRPLCYIPPLRELAPCGHFCRMCVLTLNPSQAAPVCLTQCIRRKKESRSHCLSFPKSIGHAASIIDTPIWSPERHPGPARLHSALCERRQEARYLFDA